MFYLISFVMQTSTGTTSPTLNVGLRGVLAALTAFIISSVSGRKIVPWLRRKKIGERTEATPIEDEKLVEQIAAKSGTPTMGGVIIILGLIVGCLIWGDLDNLYLLLALGAVVTFAVLGFVDDWAKLTGKSSADRGLKARHKLLVQFLLGGVIGYVLLRAYRAWDFETGFRLFLPFAPGWEICLGALIVIWCALVVATTSNATNIADGLDGLMPGLAVIAFMAMAAPALCSSHAGMSEYLNIPHVPGSGEIGLFCLAMAGACLGFLWWNSWPAQVFSGDTGSLAIGAGLAVCAVIVKQEVLLLFVGMMFFLEFGSSVLQILFFKLTGKRILPIAPVHYWCRKVGWAEQKTVARFYIGGAVSALVGLSLLG